MDIIITRAKPLNEFFTDVYLVRIPNKRAILVVSTGRALKAAVDVEKPQFFRQLIVHAAMFAHKRKWKKVAVYPSYRTEQSLFEVTNINFSCGFFPLHTQE